MKLQEGVRKREGGGRANNVPKCVVDSILLLAGRFAKSFTGCKEIPFYDDLISTIRSFFFNILFFLLIITK